MVLLIQHRQWGPQMTGTIDLLDEVLAQAACGSIHSGRPSKVAEAHACDGCEEVKPDVDLWATNSETGEELFLCLACGE
jgi:hypothetical protein